MSGRQAFDAFIGLAYLAFYEVRPVVTQNL